MSTVGTILKRGLSNAVDAELGKGESKFSTMIQDHMPKGNGLVSNLVNGMGAAADQLLGSHVGDVAAKLGSKLT